MRLPFATWGHGPTRAVFLHGFGGTRTSFDHLEPLLGDSLTATCLELPGHGEAPLPTSWDETLESIAEHLGPGAVLVGYSQGARLALGVALKYPQLVDRLVLESGSPGIHRRHDRVLRRAADGALAQLLETQGVSRFMDRWEQHPLFTGLRALPPARQQALRARREQHRPEGLAAALRVLGQGGQPDAWQQLTKLLRPTLLLTGALDLKYTRLARRMVEDLPLGWRVTFAEVLHAPHLECPEAWAAEVRAFLAPAWATEPAECAP